MTVASGVSKVVAYKAESTWGTAAGASGGRQLRRVSCDLDLEKQAYQSQEVRTEAQVVSVEHGLVSVSGSLDGEISPGTYSELIGGLLRRDFASVSSITSLSLTIATSGSAYTVTRGSGSWISDGIKTGDVVRITAGSVGTDLNKNLLVLAVTSATVLTVIPLNGFAMTAQGPVAGCTVAVPGKKSYVPQSSHTRKSFSIEQWFSDITQSELYVGCKLSALDVNMPATGLCGIKLGFMGKSRTNATSQYFSSPTAPNTYNTGAAVNGAIAVNGSAVGLVTAASFKVNADLGADPVVGSNFYPDITPGTISVEGSVSAMFQDAAMRDLFDNSTAATVTVVVTSGSAANAEFVAFTVPAAKFKGSRKNDGSKNIIQTMPFDGQMASSGYTEQSIFAVQDSQAI